MHRLVSAGGGTRRRRPGRVERHGVLGLDGTEDAANVGVAQRRRSDLEDPAHGGRNSSASRVSTAREEPREVDPRSGVARALEDRPRAVEGAAAARCASLRLRPRVFGRFLVGGDGA